MTSVSSCSVDVILSSVMTSSFRTCLEKDNVSLFHAWQEAEKVWRPTVFLMLLHFWKSAYKDRRAILLKFITRQLPHLLDHTSLRISFPSSLSIFFQTKVTSLLRKWLKLPLSSLSLPLSLPPLSFTQLPLTLQNAAMPLTNASSPLRGGTLLGHTHSTPYRIPFSRALSRAKLTTHSWRPGTQLKMPSIWRLAVNFHPLPTWALPNWQARNLSHTHFLRLCSRALAMRTFEVRSMKILADSASVFTSTIMLSILQAHRRPRTSMLVERGPIALCSRPSAKVERDLYE